MKSFWLLSAGIAALASPAHAQDQGTDRAQAATEAAQADEGDAIIVTAQGRRQILQDAGVVGLTDVEQRGDAIWTRKIKIGEINITDVDVIYGDMHVFKAWDLEDEPALLVGMDVLGVLHTIVVDYRRKELQIRPRGARLHMF